MYSYIPPLYFQEIFFNRLPFNEIDKHRVFSRSQPPYIKHLSGYSVIP